MCGGVEPSVPVRNAVSCPHQSCMSLEFKLCDLSSKKSPSASKDSVKNVSRPMKSSF